MSSHKMVAGEISAALATALVGLAAVVIAKSKCFCRNIDGDCQYGVAFSDKAIIPDDGRFETVELNSDVLIVKK